MAHRPSSLSQWLNDEVRSSRADVLALLMAFSSALIDTVTLPALQTFVANSTGNLLLLGLGAAGLQGRYPDLIHPARSGIAMGCSWLGSFVTGYSSRRFNARTRWWLFSQFAFEALLVYICAILVYTGAAPLTGGGNKDLALIALTAYSYGCQSVSIKNTGVPAIPAQVVTGAMAALFSDENLFARNNLKRNQRAAFIIVFFLGCVIGGLALVRVNGGLVLILTASFKLLAAAGFLVMPGIAPPISVEDGASKPTVQDDNKGSL